MSDDGSDIIDNQDEINELASSVINNQINPLSIENETNENTNIIDNNININNHLNISNLLNNITSEIGSITTRINRNIQNINDLNTNFNTMSNNFDIFQDSTDYNFLNFIQEEILKVIKEFPFGKNFLYFSTLLSIMFLLILCTLVLQFHGFKTIQELTLKYLESDDDFLYYVFLLVKLVILLITWNFYSFISIFIFTENNDLENNNQIFINTKEFIFFTPYWIYTILRSLMPYYISTMFDVAIIVCISIQYEIIYIFSSRLFLNSINKISLRLNFIWLIFMNIFTTAFITYIFMDTDIYFKLIIYNKVIFY